MYSLHDLKEFIRELLGAEKNASEVSKTPEAELPNDHNNTTTITSNTKLQTDIERDQKNIRIVEIVLNVLGFIVIQSSGFLWNERGIFFDVVTVIGFLFTGILLFYGIGKRKILWLKIEFFYCCFMVCMYFICSCYVAAYQAAGYTIAGFIGFCAMIAYGFDAYLKYKVIAGDDQIIQGMDEDQKQTITTN